MSEQQQKLTAAEQRCCHMRHCEPDSQWELDAWRAEFQSIRRDEHCRDCPMFAGVAS